MHSSNSITAGLQINGHFALNTRILSCSGSVSRTEKLKRKKLTSQIEGNYNKTNKFIVKISFFGLDWRDSEDCNKNAVKSSQKCTLVCMHFFETKNTQKFLKSRDHRRWPVESFQYSIFSSTVCRFCYAVCCFQSLNACSSGQMRIYCARKRQTMRKEQKRRERGANENKIKFFIAHFQLTATHNSRE